MRQVAWSAPATLALVAFAASGSIAQAQTTRVVPPHAVLEDQPARSFFPFTFDATRTQQLWDGTAIAANIAVITGFAYRQETKQQQVSLARAIPAMTLELGYSNLTPLTMSTTFAQNQAGARTTVFSGSFNLPALPSPMGPGTWIPIPLTSPFTYVPAQGNLMLELVVPGVALQRNEYLLDAVQYPPTPAPTVTAFGTAGRSNASMPALGGGVVAGSFVVDVQATNYRSPPPTSVGFLMFGVTASVGRGFLLPIDLAPLGAPGNYLYIDPLITLPVTLAPYLVNFIYRATYSVPLPSAVPGTLLYSQAALVDPRANAAGLVLSQGLVLELCCVPTITQLLVSSNSGSPTGMFAAVTLASGPVVRFTGTFQ